MPRWLVDVIVAVPGVGALIACWRIGIANRLAIHRLARAINRIEQTVAALEGREPRPVHPFESDDDE